MSQTPRCIELDEDCIQSFAPWRIFSTGRLARPRREADHSADVIAAA